MREIVRGMLILYVFCIPWEYSLVFSEPVGNVARVVGLLLMLVAPLAVVQGERMRAFGSMQWIVLVLYLWLCCTCFWSVDLQASLSKVRGLAQEMMVVWIVWQFADRITDLRTLMRAFVAGSVVLAVLSLANRNPLEEATIEQIRQVAAGQDPNDVARYLVLGLPMAAMLVKLETWLPWRLLAFGFLPLGAAGILLTASRSGFLAGVVAFLGCSWMLLRGRPLLAIAAIAATPVVAAGLWFAVPHAIFARLSTIPEQVVSADLNLRWNIWIAGWEAFVHAPVLGSGVGTFSAASDLAPIDTAHNTVLSILVGGGLCALFLAFSVVVVAVYSILRSQDGLRMGVAVMLVALAMTSLVSTVEESRSTWLLLALVAAAGSLEREDANAPARSAPSPASMLSSTNADLFGSASDADGTPIA